MVEVTRDLFCDVRFSILFVLTGFYMTGSSVVFTYLAWYAKTMGVQDWEAELLVSIMGGFSLGGRWVNIDQHAFDCIAVINVTV